MKRRGWKIGAPVTVTLEDGTRVDGQVWAMADVANYAWLALDNGQFVAVFMPTRRAAASPRGERIGRVAA